MSNCPGISLNCGEELARESRRPTGWNTMKVCSIYLDLMKIMIIFPGARHWTSVYDWIFEPLCKITQKNALTDAFSRICVYFQHNISTAFRQENLFFTMFTLFCDNFESLPCFLKSRLIFSIKTFIIFVNTILTPLSKQAAKLWLHLR